MLNKQVKRWYSSSTICILHTLHSLLCLSAVLLWYLSTSISKLWNEKRNRVRWILCFSLVIHVKYFFCGNYIFIFSQFRNGIHIDRSILKILSNPLNWQVSKIETLQFHHFFVCLQQTYTQKHLFIWNYQKITHKHYFLQIRMVRSNSSLLLTNYRSPYTK